MAFLLEEKVIVTYLDNMQSKRTENGSVIGRTLEDFPKYDVQLDHNGYLLKNIKEKWLKLR
mgnify:FL=1